MMMKHFHSEEEMSRTIGWKGSWCGLCDGSIVTPYTSSFFVFFIRSIQLDDSRKLPRVNLVHETG